MEIPKEAECKKNKLCFFKETKEYSDAFREVCVYCGKKMIWRKDEFGRIDNRKYVRAHLRHFAQPWGGTANIYRLIYGEENFRNAVNKPRPKKLNWDEAAEDAKKMVQELRKERQTL